MVTESPNKATALIPIGIDCSVALYLRDIRERKQAFPFDWNVTPISSAIELIHDGFAEFMFERNLMYLPQADRTLVREQEDDVRILPDIVTPVIDTKNKILFPHDFSVVGKADIVSVRQKYERRILRLKEVLKKAEEIVFIYNLREPNFWQAKQYQLANVSFPTDKMGELRMGFEILKDIYSNTIIRFVSLSEFDMAKND